MMDISSRCQKQSVYTMFQHYQAISASQQASPLFVHAKKSAHRNNAPTDTNALHSWIRHMPASPAEAIPAVVIIPWSRRCDSPQPAPPSPAELCLPPCPRSRD